MKNKLFKLFILLIFLFSANKIIFAANLSINSSENNLQNNQSFVAHVVLDTKGQSINTIEGDLNYDNEYLTVQSINIGKSFISLWIDKPQSRNDAIHFSGMIPGGLDVPEAPIFDVNFITKKEGGVRLNFSNLNFYINDGKGTPAQSTFSPFDIAISSKVSELKNPIPSDHNSPEKFNIVRTKDNNIYDGKEFIVFNTQDKESGVDKYRVCEFFVCSTSDSPYLLKNQTPFYFIKVISYDVAGNHTSSFLFSSELIMLCVSVFIVFSFLIFFFIKKRKKL